MSDGIVERLNQIPERILSNEFLQSQGLGNEIGFWIFDYDAADELKVREYLTVVENTVVKRRSDLKLVNINLLQGIHDYLGSRQFLNKAVQMEKTKGLDALFNALKGPLHVDKFAPFLIEHYNTAENDIIFISGVGSVWPLLRAHNLLNKLHALLGHKPLVLFYPGQYDGQVLQLFGKIKSDSYYRAFRLVP